MKSEIKNILLVGMLLVLVAGAIAYSYFADNVINPDTDIKRFNSYEELVKFVNSSNQDGYGYYGSGAVGLETANVADASSKSSGGMANDYSTTNIQVEGVDEADIVKNDGKYIYMVSNGKVFIVEAYPADEMKIISEINITNVGNIFLNGNKLIVLANEYVYSSYNNQGDGIARDGIALQESKSSIAPCRGYRCGGYGEEFTRILVYDISDKEDVKIESNMSMSGNYRDSRMIGDYVYVISSKYIYNDVVLPMYEVNGVVKTIEANQIGYFGYDYNYVFTSVAAINLGNDEINVESYLTGSTGNIYVSEDNIYLTVNQYMDYRVVEKRMIEEVVLPLLPNDLKDRINIILDSDNGDYSNYDIGRLIENYSNSLIGNERAKFDSELAEKLEEFQRQIAKEYEKTIVHKINIDKDKINYEGKGDIPGYTLNQFSLDEYKGNLRIATTTSQWNREGSANHLYVLDEGLDVVGKVEDLAKGERIYSVRFMGERAYMVTFRQVDPLYVIDLGNPEKPEVLGYLKVTGYSSYLHPYDENHIIGVGMEANEEGRVTGLKIALFDVSDVENVKESARYEIDEGWSSSNALYDHKAFLFDKEKGILVIPVEVNNYNGIYKHWQGVYVFDISEDNICLKGKKTHVEKYVPKYGPAENEENGAIREGYGQSWEKIGANKWKSNATYRYYDIDYGTNYGYENTVQDSYIGSMPGGINYVSYDYASNILRSLYMDDVLYTVSYKVIQANDLGSLGEISSVDLPYQEDYYPGAL